MPLAQIAQPCYPTGVLPIAIRELQVVARKPAIYRQRALIGGAAALLAFLSILFSRSAPDKAGAILFNILSWSVFGITVLDCIRCAGDSISWERREGTLGLLFLTDLRGFEVVLGKFVSGATKAFTTLIVTIPILALPLMMGGVTPAEWARTILSLVLTVLFSLSAALMISSLSTGALPALSSSLLLIAGAMAIPFAVAELVPGAQGLLWLSGPLGMLNSSRSYATGALTGTFLPALLFSFISVGAMLTATCFLVSRTGSFDSRAPRGTWLSRLVQPSPVGKTPWGTGYLDYSPAIWLALRTLPGQKTLRLLVIIGAVLSMLIPAFSGSGAAVGAVVSIQVVFCMGIKLWLGAVAPQSLHACRSSGAMELLLCTPLRPTELVKGQMHTLVRYFRKPAAIICIGYPFLSIFGALLGQQSFKEMEIIFYMLLFGIGWFFVFLMDLYALAYTGLWFGLTSVKIEQAVGKTIGYVLLLPWLSQLVPFVGCFGWIFWPIFWICWSSYRLNHRFTEKVAEQFGRPAGS